MVDVKSSVTQRGSVVLWSGFQNEVREGKGGRGGGRREERTRPGGRGRSR